MTRVTQMLLGGMVNTIRAQKVQGEMKKVEKHLHPFFKPVISGFLVFLLFRALSAAVFGYYKILLLFSTAF